MQELRNRTSVKCALWLALLLLVALATYRLSYVGQGCSAGICIHLEIAKPVEALEPALTTITVRTKKDIPRLGVSLFGDAGAVEILKAPGNAVVEYQDKVSVDWRLDTKGGETYTFSAYVVFDAPPTSYGVFSYLVIALATNSGKGTANDSVRIYLDAAGNQIDADKAREMEGPLRATVIFGAPEPTATMTPAAALPASPSPGRTMGALELHVQTLEEYLTPTPVGTLEDEKTRSERGILRPYRSDTGLVCDRGLCVGLDIRQPVHMREPALATVTLLTEADTVGVQMSLSSIFSGVLQEPIESPKGSTMVRREERFIFWSMDTVGGEAYTFSAHVLFDQPVEAKDVDRFEVAALATQSLNVLTGDMVTIYLDATGNQVEPVPPTPGRALPVTPSAWTSTPMPGVTKRPTRTPTSGLTMPIPTATFGPTPTVWPTWTRRPTVIRMEIRTIGYPTLDPAATPIPSRAYPGP